MTKPTNATKVDILRLIDALRAEVVALEVLNSSQQYISALNAARRALDKVLDKNLDETVQQAKQRQEFYAALARRDASLKEDKQ